MVGFLDLYYEDGKVIALPVQDCLGLLAHARQLKALPGTVQRVTGDISPEQAQIVLAVADILDESPANQLGSVCNRLPPQLRRLVGLNKQDNV